MVDTETLLDREIEQRGKPRFLILDERMRIVFADWAAMFTLRITEQPGKPLEVLPAPLDEAVRRAVESLEDDAQAERVIQPLDDVVLRVSRLAGDKQRYIAVACESRTRRDDVARAAKAFGFTRREQNVLSLLVAGLPESEIAKELLIDESAVREQVDSLLRKTGSNERSHLISRVLKKRA